MKKHFSIRVSGVVQGVFFRASAKEVADQLGVKGFVRNEPNGEVYIEAEAEEETLKRFVEWCHQGPPRSRVATVDIAERTQTGAVDFKIIR
jgi:acylphosphatase